ncbi:MAG TPA: ATP-binding protein, partial [Alphaproteobacteria bacterium]
MTGSEAATNQGPERRASSFGVRARLLLAFFAISGFAILAAAAGIYAFREVGGRLDVVDTRVPPALTALELSRSAERIIAAAPALLATTDRTRRDEVKAELAAEVERLNGKLLELKNEGTKALPLEKIEAVVSSLTASLAALEDVVARRLDISERIRSLRSRVFQTNEETQRLLAPWLEVMGGQISALVEDVRKTNASGLSDTAQRLESLIQLQRLTQTAQRQVSAVVDMLAEASTTEQARRIPILNLQLGLALRDLDEVSAGLDPKLRPLFLAQVAKFREFVAGPNAIAEARGQELALVGEGAKRLAVTADLSAQLTAAVDQLGSAAKQDVGEAVRDALSVQRLSTRALVALVALSLLTSVLIVWLYVGRNIVRRLTALSDGMLAIAGGSLHAPVAVEGADEIAAMGRAAEIFRRNTLERDGLLAERAQAADLLEKEVKQRTAELAQSVEELRALGEVSRAVNSTVDLKTVLTTIVAKAVQLSDTEAGAIYVYDDATRQFQLRATYGMDEAVIAEVRDHQLRLSETAVGEAAARGIPVQIPDVQSDPSSPVLDVIVRAGYRALLFVPLLGVDRIVGALVVRRKQPGEFPKSTIELLQTFAAQSVLAIQNARLFEEIQDKSRQLEVANKYKSHFLASASHDLRQPLHAMNLFVAQLRTESDPEERDRLIGRIDAAVGAMNELFEALLDMSKLEAGILEPNFTEFPVDRLFKRIETTFADAARKKGLRLVVAPSGAWVRSDFVLLERILFNLVSNAVRYTARGGVVVGGRRRGGQLRIDVCDTGPGIPEEQQRNVFGEFYQLAGADRRGGLGLGLAIVDRLGGLLGHPIDLRSRPGRGSRFSVSVPLAAERRRADEASVASAIADPAHGKLVLVIDDDPLVIDGMGGILRSWGCKVLRADSEESALAVVAAQRQRPDLIIADYR